MDPVTQALSKTGVETVAQGTAGFLRRIAGPAADEIGFLLQDHVRLYRYKNQLRMVEKAQKWAADLGRPIRPVPPRVLLPLLEGGALEEEAPLADMWAALLARAATSGEKQTVLPSYPTILRQLAPADALVLDVLFRWRPDPLGNAGDQWGPEVDFIFTLSRMDERAELDLVLDNLVGLGLIERRPSFFSVIGDDGKTQDQMTTKRAFRLTTLGRHFVASCASPDTPLPVSNSEEPESLIVEEPEGVAEPLANEDVPPGLFLREPEFLPGRETDAYHVILLTLGPAVEEVWGAIRRIPREPDEQVWKRIAQATQPFFVVERLKPGEPPTLRIPKPSGGEFTVYQIEPRLVDQVSGRLLAGPVWRGVLRREDSAE